MHGKIFILVSKMIKFKSHIPTGRLADNQLLKFSISHPQIYRVILYFNWRFASFNFFPARKKYLQGYIILHFI